MLTNVISIICVIVWLTNYKSFLDWENKPGSSWIPDPASVKFNFVKCTYYFKARISADSRPVIVRDPGWREPL